jgi:arylformamidase
MTASLATPTLYREFSTQAQIDAQYNPSIALADPAAPGKHFVAQSALARATLKHHLDVPFGATVQETLDIFPADVPNAPVFVFIHGGYWRSLDKSDHSFVAPALHDMGACVVVVNYALCPGTPEQAVTIPDIALQMAKATAWVWRHIAEHGGDRGSISAIGHSAGGHLAAMLLGCDWKKVGHDLSAGLVRKALSISGLFDLEPMRKTPFLQGDLRLTPAQVRMCSPAKWRRPRQGGPQ